jgi:hypothetical protein
MRHKRALLLTLFTVLLLLLLTTAAQAKQRCVPAQTQKPTHVLIVVMDQMRPEYVNMFGMQNIRWLQQHGVTFPRAYVGHVASETVVSHNVMVSGQLPKHMGWSDEVLRDTGNVLNGGAGGLWLTSGFSIDQFSKLITAADYPKLADYLHAAYPGTKFAVVGEKSYPVESIVAQNTSIAAPYSDIAVRLGSLKTSPDYGIGPWRGPSGQNVPTYISQPAGGRFYINADATNYYGTEAGWPSWIVPEDGNRYVPGFDPAHLGGDNWAADAAMAIMDNEKWSGMVVTLGGIDKIGHMWGGIVDTGIYAPGSVQEMIHMPFIARNADAQLGRMMDKLRSLGELDDTLIVVTADHASTHADNFYGVNALNVGNNNWYYGASLNGTYSSPPPAIQPLLDTGNVAFAFQGQGLETWLKDTSWSKKVEAAKVMRTLPGVEATYILAGDHYVLDTATQTSTTMTFKERMWWWQHGQELVDTMACSGAADVIGLVANKTSYGAYGDHGSYNKDVQHIPMVIYTPGIKHDVSRTPMRLVDIMPTVLKTMGIPLTHSVDGRAIRIEMKQAWHH